MKSPNGRRIIRRILEFTEVDADTFDADPIKHARNAGKRAVGLWLRDELKLISPDQLLIMIKEEIENHD